MAINSTSARLPPMLLQLQFSNTTQAQWRPLAKRKYQINIRAFQHKSFYCSMWDMFVLQKIGVSLTLNHVARIWICSA